MIPLQSRRSERRGFCSFPSVSSPWELTLCRAGDAERSDPLLLVRSMRAAVGDEANWRFPIHDLLDRIGMHDTILETDPYGNYILSRQVFSTPRDLARLGLLFLNDGLWEGQRILPEGWVAFSTRPAPARKRGIGGLLAYGIQGFIGYGAQIWLYHPIPGVLSHQGYSGVGHRGQYVTIVPSRELVVVRRTFQSLSSLGLRAQAPRC